MWDSIMIYIAWALPALAIFLWAGCSEHSATPPIDERDWIQYLPS
jgi:hypothetical protein